MGKGFWRASLCGVPGAAGESASRSCTMPCAHAFRQLARRDCTSVGVQVDSQNPTGATRLYERAGMHVLDTWDVYEKGVTA